MTILRWLAASTAALGLLYYGAMYILNDAYAAAFRSAAMPRRLEIPWVALLLTVLLIAAPWTSPRWALHLVALAAAAAAVSLGRVTIPGGPQVYWVAAAVWLVRYVTVTLQAA